jgi:hypothetical protein
VIDAMSDLASDVLDDRETARMFTTRSSDVPTARIARSLPAIDQPSTKSGVLGCTHSASI